jgi:outer membrane protein OmpA-like peptidoglycan-associated protein
VTDSKHDPKSLPPDDFSATTPNIRVPKENSPDTPDTPSASWEKTNYNFGPVNPKQGAAGADFGKTIINPLASHDPPRVDSAKPRVPNQSPSAPPDYGLTQPRFDINDVDFGGQKQADLGATTPYFRLPEVERARYQQAAPIAAPAVQNQSTENKKDGGVPAWAWIAGLALMFFIIAATLVGAYFLFSNKHGFDVVIKGAAPGSEVFVDGTRWGLTSADGSIKLTGLNAGPRKIEIKNPNYLYEPEEARGEDGGKTIEIIAKGKQTQRNDECAIIRLGEFDKAERCANLALDALRDPFTPEDLVRALNIFIINFESGSFAIPQARMKFLGRAATYIQKLPKNVVLEVGGHTDNRGSRQSNQILSENRARAVRDALVRFGVRTDVLQTRGYGDTKPKISNDTEDGRFHNRRIEYSVISK